MRLFVSTCLFLLLWVNVVEGKEKLIWSTGDLPPGLCYRIQTERPCFVNYMVSLLQEKLPHYQHESYFANVKRIMYDLEMKKKPIIAPAMSYTEKRKKIIKFSHTVPFPRLPYIVIVREEDKKRFDQYLNKKGEVNLNDIFADDLKTLIYDGRSYGGYLDAIIEKYRDKSFSIANYTNAIGMEFLRLKRVDFIIIFPPHAFYVLEKMGAEFFETHMYRIEGIPPYIEARLAASKSSFGQKLIKEVNALLYDEEIIKKSTENYKSWLPKNLRAYYDKIAEQYQTERRELDGLGKP